MAEKKRRRKGEGGVYQRPNGTWAAIVDLGTDEAGKRHRCYVYGKTSTEAAKKLRNLTREIEQGIVPTRREDKTSIATFLEHWLADAITLKVRSQTLIDYRAIVRIHINPRIGTKSLDKLTPRDIQALYGNLHREKIGDRTRQKVHVVLHQAMSYAMKMQLIHSNPIEHIDPPRYVPRKMSPLKLDQLLALIDASTDYWMKAAIAVSGFLGLRQSELLALRWKDIDFQVHSISISRGTEKFIAGDRLKRRISDTKNRSSNRRIAIPQNVLKHLKNHFETSNFKGADDLAFSNENGKLVSHSWLKWRFRPILEQANVPVIRWHDLRHTAATIMLSLGTHPKVVMEILGHSKITTTMDLYSHSLPHMQTDTMDKLDNAIQQAGPLGSKIGSNVDCDASI